MGKIRQKACIILWYVIIYSGNTNARKQSFMIAILAFFLSDSIKQFVENA